MGHDPAAAGDIPTGTDEAGGEREAGGGEEGVYDGGARGGVGEVSEGDGELGGMGSEGVRSFFNLFVHGQSFAAAVDISLCAMLDRLMLC